MELKLGYKQTEVGVIPVEWNTINLSEEIGLVSGQHVMAVDYNTSGHGIPYLTGPADFVDGDAVTTKWAKLNRVDAIEGDILVTVKGSGAGKVFILNISKATISRQLMRLRSKHINQKFLFYALQSLEKLLSKQAVGNLIPGLARRDIFSLRIAQPPIAEQEAIAKALSDMDALIQSLEQQIIKKQQIKQGAMQAMLNPYDASGNIKIGWIIQPLGDCLEKIVGGGTPSRSNKSYWGKELPWATVKDFSTFDASHTQEYITYEGLKNSAANLIPKGTIVISTRMALGKAVVYDVDICINQDLKALIPKKYVSIAFLKHWFSANAKHIEELGSGSTVAGISLPDLKGIPFYHPQNTIEQNEIADQLSSIDIEIGTLRNKLSKNKKLKQGMMQNLLTGTVRLV